MAMFIIPDLVYTHHLFHVLNMTILKKKMWIICVKLWNFFLYTGKFLHKSKSVYMKCTIVNACAKYFSFIMQAFLVSTVHYELLFSLSLLCFKCGHYIFNL